MKEYIIMNKEADNSATATNNIPKGSNIKIRELELKINEDIQIGHKFALKDIAKGEYIKKYGKIIGVATENIQKGGWIHTHNITSRYLEEVNDE
ncbi:MAG: UxaA family hydrolase [Promethearchaeia archaeon]